jgi:hypothetical protein
MQKVQPKWILKKKFWSILGQSDFIQLGDFGQTFNSDFAEILTSYEKCFVDHDAIALDAYVSQVGRLSHPTFG